MIWGLIIKDKRFALRAKAAKKAWENSQIQAIFEAFATL